MIKKNKIELGKKGEKIAAEYLNKNGYKILEMNYRCKLGEIDIIANKKNTYVFVEVKTRRNLRFGYPAEAINVKKRQHMLRTAQYYIQIFHLTNRNFRFDAIEIYFSDTEPPKINHIQNIFF